MLASVIIGDRQVGPGEKVFVIAEVGINHNGDFDTAERLIQKASEAGADAVKLQTYITEKRVPAGSPIFGILKQCELSFQQQAELFEYARGLGIEIFSTPFDIESVDFLHSVGCNCYKIASFDIVNRELLRAVASKEKPVVISRGMATKDEIDTAMSIIGEKSNQAVLLHCVSAYPVADPASLNLSTINALRQRYGCPVGFSDHTMGIWAAELAVAAGAVVVEKHFTLSRQAEGPDHALSTEPDELKQMIEVIRRAELALGSPAWGPVEAEKDILQYRRERD